MTDPERAVFDERMATCQAYLDRYQATHDLQLLLDPAVISKVRELRDWATGAAGWQDAEHLCGWFHWLRYQALGESRGAADREVAEQFFQNRYSLRPHDLPEPVRQRLEAEFRQRFDAVMTQVAEQTRRRRPNRKQLRELYSELSAICNFTARSNPQYFDRLDARANVAELARDETAEIDRQQAVDARTEKGQQPPPANPPWRPFDYRTYFGI